MHATAAGGRLYVATGASVLAFDAASGRLAWMYPDVPEAPRDPALAEAVHAPAVADGRVYVVDASGGPVDDQLFHDMMKALPPRYRKNKRQLRFYTSEDGEAELRRFRAQRETAVGDKYLETDTPILAAGTPVVGVTYDPVRDELFEAGRGIGTCCNGRPLSVSSAESLEDSLLGTGFPFKARDFFGDYLKTFNVFFNASRGVRRAGSATLDFA